MLKWTFGIVLFGLLLLGAIYLVYIFTANITQLESNATIKVPIIVILIIINNIFAITTK